jgi:hypothetical protein
MMEMAINEEYGSVFEHSFADEATFVGLHNYLVTYMKIRTWAMDMENDEQ